MNEHLTYNDYFAIDPKYYAAVTADLINSGKVKWNAFYPHDTFIRLLEKTHTMLSGRDSRSLWVEGAYGSGKSHAALTIKSLLEASDDEIKAYFNDFGIKGDLCQKLITDKQSGKLVTIHRIGSASIRSDRDLILAIQDSITAALKKHGIENKGEASLKDAALKWLEDKEANRIYFNSLISEDKYMWQFGGQNVDQVIEILKNCEDENILSKMMRNIMTVAEDNGITALRMDIPAMCEWIKSILDNNDISAILFVWDEFTEYFQNNSNTLTGFQTLTEISQSHPFYFLIVTHRSQALFEYVKRDEIKKILNRFVGDTTIELSMPDNMAFRLMAQAMKETKDPVLLPQWHEYKDTLNEDLAGVRSTIISTVKKTSKMGDKTLINDDELKAIVPIHPYAALMLKHMSVAFNSNARSMFDFIISNDMTEAKAFKWFISEYGPLDDTNLITIDMLWDFFNGKGQKGLNEDVQVILDSFSLLKKGSLTPDQERVFKTILLLEALSQRVSDVELLRPNEQNVDLAFNGTDWSRGKARSIAAGLCQEGLLFERPVGKGLKEYTVANRDGDGNKIAKLKEKIEKDTKTHDLIISADLMAAVKLPAPIEKRFVMRGTSTSPHFTIDTNKLSGEYHPNRFKVIVTFALSDTEASSVHSYIIKSVSQPSNKMMFIESLVPMGRDLLSQYVENMAYSENYAQSDKQRSKGFEEQANKCLTEWRQRISNGAFVIYTPENKSGIRVPNLPALQDELTHINHQVYYYGLEQFSLTDVMFTKSTTAMGADCGITQNLRQMYNSGSSKTSLSEALKGAWKVEKYWEDPAKKSLPIVKIKQKVDSVIAEGFAKPSGRVSILSIYQALEEAPFGFMPTNVSAFVIGFVLKEYANSNYFWSNDSKTEVMTADKMKKMIAEAINQTVSPSNKYKEEYIVTMGESTRCFLECTSAAFHIPQAQCGSVEAARDQMRIKMKGLIFPIWCVKYILGDVQLESSADKISDVIEAYCGIANTANSNRGSESENADHIGTLVHEDRAITRDLECLFTNEMCRKGMLAYIDIYEGGALKKLAMDIDDHGAYIDQVKKKFNADAANWVWSSATADEKISDVILEYRIITESNKILPKSISLQDVVVEWNKRSNYIKIPYEVLRKHVGDLKMLFEQLYYMKTSGQLQEQNKQRLYDALLTYREAFDRFYKDQLSYFKKAAASFIDELDEQDIASFFSKIPSGQFTKTSQEYFRYIEKEVEEFRKGIRKTVLKELWYSKTNTKDPSHWSEIHNTPILCVFSDSERTEAKAVFSTLLAHSPSDSDIEKAIKYLENASFYDRLNDSAEIDRCFMERVVGSYSVMLSDADQVRKQLEGSVADKPYYWMDNSTVQNKLKKFAEKQYKLTGSEQVRSVIDKMDAGELRRYLNELIEDNLTVGMEILKNQ